MTLKLVTCNDSVTKEPHEILHEASITAIIDAMGDDKAIPVTPEVLEKIIQAYAEQGDRKKVRQIFQNIDDQRKAAGIITNKKSFVSELDTPEAINTVDLLSFVDDKHLLKRLSLEVSSTFHLPQSTVFLMGLGVFSSVSCRKMVVNYQDNKACLPIGLYVIAEQPSGVGKSRCLNTFETEFTEIHRSIAAARKKEINRLLKDKELNDGELSEDNREELFDLQNTPIPQLYTTNATPEGLERTLADNKGFFAAISSEQGLFNSLFGKTYANGANNNDVVLNGFDAGFINVNRAGRTGYSGNVVGAVVCFAQQGSIETILDASQGTGLSERFLMLVEPHRLGQRDHKKINQLTDRLLIEYQVACGFGLEVFNEPKEFSDLSHLFITEKGFEMIADYQNEIEPHLRDGEKYSFPALRGVASKINMQIMKIAANLHLLDDGFYMPYIVDKHVESAIKIADRLLQHQLKMMRDKGIIGIKAEYQSILALFEVNNAPLTYRQIVQSKRNRPPFKESASPSEAIRNTLEEMVRIGLLELFDVNSETGKPKELYRLGQ